MHPCWLSVSQRSKQCTLARWVADCLARLSEFFSFHVENGPPHQTRGAGGHHYY